MISVTILIKNCSSTIEEALASVASFPEVILLDTGSTDTTLKIASHFPNVKVFSSPFIGFGPLHNLVSSLATHDWIFSLDSDEKLSGELVKEIQSLKLDSRCVYEIPRHNYLNGKWIKGCSGWHPDNIVRLYNRTTTRFTDSHVHERVLSESLKKVKLKNPMLHKPYRSISDFLNKMQLYSTLFADERKGKESSSFFKALVHAWAAFLKSYILKRGFLLGKEGYIISSYLAQCTFYKYLKLKEFNSQQLR